MRGALKSVAGAVAFRACALDCTQLESRRAVINSVHFLRVSGRSGRKNPYLPGLGRHEMPVRTQCLTSAAHRLCPHPNSLALLSPIPKLASVARPPATRHSSTGSPPNPLTLRHLIPPNVRPWSAWLCSSPADACVPCRLSQLASPNSRPVPRKRRNEPKRRATFIVARPGSSCKSH